MRFNSIGVPGPWICIGEDARCPIVCCNIISLHGAQMCNARTKLGCQEKIWRLHVLELAKSPLSRSLTSPRLRKCSVVSRTGYVEGPVSRLTSDDPWAEN